MTEIAVNAPSTGITFGDSAEWKPLGYFILYRLALCGLLVVLYFWGIAPLPVGYYDTGLFRNVAFGYAIFSLLAAVANRMRLPAYDAQVLIQVFADIVAITLLMHASGGVSSGFGMLLLVAIAGGSVLTQGRIAILFAAMASIAVLTQQIFVWITSPFPTTHYTQAGILGASLFATAYLAHISARRIRMSEALAARREVDLANLSQLNEHIISRMQAGILVVDAHNRIRLVNESARHMLGLEAYDEGARVENVLPKLAGLLQTWRGDRGRPSHLFQHEGTQMRLICSFAGIGQDAVDGVLVFIEDASAITQQAQQLKLASLGRMAASIAHEIRNPLGAISHAGQLLSESSGLADGDRRLTEMIRENSMRMNAIIENVLRISRGKPAKPELVALKPWLEEFSEAFVDANEISMSCFTVSVEPENVKVRVDPSQLHQVVWNLCENGLNHSNGTPCIDLRARISNSTERPYLDIRDNGDGLSEEEVEQIFEPFFTTRDDGSGLGLYIARELCEGNKAALNFVAVDEGACFRISFSDPRREGVVSA
jgi:two-component system sensor histidine kinase PilS (NtrC family)